MKTKPEESKALTPEDIKKRKAREARALDQQGGGFATTKAAVEQIKEEVKDE